LNQLAAVRAGNTRWRIFAVLFGMAFLSYALRQNIQVAGQFIAPEFALTELQMGWIYGAFIWGYALFQLPGGMLGERFGARRLLTVLGLLWLLTTLLTALLPGLFVGSTLWIIGSLMLIRFATGIVHAPIFPVQAGVLAAWFPVGNWGLPNALLSTGLALGAAATQPLVAWIMVTWGWRIAFYVFVPLGLALFAFWWWYARDNPQEHPGVGEAELALIRHGRERYVDAGAGRAWMRLLRNRETLLLALSYFSMNYVFYLFFTWFFHYLVHERGFSILETGVLAALPWLTGAATAALGGWTCDRLCARIGARLGCRLPAMAGMFGTAVFLCAGLYVDSAYTAVALLSLCFASTQFTEAAYWQAQTYVAGPHTASATGIMNTGANFSGILVAPLVPWLALHWGWVPALSTGVLLAVLGGAVWMFIRADVPFEDSAG
jgi:MFS transporter, ACS family, glucarate transporter